MRLLKKELCMGLSSRYPRGGGIYQLCPLGLQDDKDLQALLKGPPASEGEVQPVAGENASTSCKRTARPSGRSPARS